MDDPSIRDRKYISTAPALPQFIVKMKTYLVKNENCVYFIFLPSYQPNRVGALINRKLHNTVKNKIFVLTLKIIAV